MNLANKYLEDLEHDKFHHLGFSTETKDVKKLFGDVRFVCMSGSVSRATKFSKLIAKELKICREEEIENLCSTDRYVMFKVGPVLVANHGMGVPSTSIILHELFKLLHYAGAEDLIFFRIGTCGGLGVDAGTVVLTRKAVDGLLQAKHTQVFYRRTLMSKLSFDGKTYAMDVFLVKQQVAALLKIRSIAEMILGSLKEYDTEFEHSLADEILQLVDDDKTDVQFDVQMGDTMCCDDFYEAQARLDGALCSFTKSEKNAFLRKAYDSGVRNLEMESLVFASMCNRLKVRACIVCVVLVNRLSEENSTDQVLITNEQYRDFEERPGYVVLQYIKKSISEKETKNTNGAV